MVYVMTGAEHHFNQKEKNKSYSYDYESYHAAD